MSTECLWLRVMKVIHRLHEIFKVAQRFIRVAAQNTCSVPHSDISLCVRERMKPQLDGEYQRGVWNPESNPDCVRTHTHTQCALWLNKAVFWWVAMNALPHTSHPKLTELTSQPSDQVPALPVVTVLNFLLTFFSVQEASDSQKNAQTYPRCVFKSLNQSHQILEHSGSLSLSALPKFPCFCKLCACTQEMPLFFEGIIHYN